MGQQNDSDEATFHQMLRNIYEELEEDLLEELDILEEEPPPTKPKKKKKKKKKRKNTPPIPQPPSPPKPEEPKEVAQNITLVDGGVVVEQQVVEEEDSDNWERVESKTRGKKKEK